MMKNPHNAIDISSISHDAAAPRLRSNRTKDARYVNIDKVIVAFAGPPEVIT